MFDEIPDGMITVPDAARKYEVSPSTVRSWVLQNDLPFLGRLRGSARGGGMILTRESEVVRMAQQPRPRGPRRRSA